MATEEILMAGVRAGGDRQELHEQIRTHSLAAAEQVKLHGQAERSDRPPARRSRIRRDRFDGVLDATASSGVPRSRSTRSFRKS